MKKIIYDFDGTLTTKGLPFYDFFKVCDGPKSVDEWILESKKLMEEKNINLYETLYEVLFNIVNNSNLPLDNSTFCMGVENVEYNPGVIEFLKEKDENIKHYILTSGYDEYVMHTDAGKSVDKVYGTSFKYQNGEFLGIKELMDDAKKPEKIDIIADGNYNDVIYVGDGFTDMYAFKHIIKNGGKAVLVHRPGDDSAYGKIKEEGIDVIYFDADYRKESKLYSFLKGNN